ncbi:uncharacterized protein LOC129915148 [Episyrphus balteatus]|uniref:uncharacterized protein LOC129915148 n=1 Tax=Episyrphus balteatus TaxID=286459 RepID=UPI0024851CA6|nr:uncharacterized protein LOC129915148 [Episyrphus balteatus]
MNLSATKKLIQVSEEIQKPLHVPVVLGNECFIITQQDVRKIEDSRFISYHKLGPNGELIPVETVYGQDIALRDAILIAGGCQNQQQTVNQQLLEMLGKCCGQKQEPPKPIKASIAQQMEWASTCNNLSPPFPFTHSTSTSMSDMPHPKIPKCCCAENCCCTSRKYFTHQGSNTKENDDSAEHIEGSLSARQMLKIRKSIEDTVGL